MQLTSKHRQSSVQKTSLHNSATLPSMNATHQLHHEDFTVNTDPRDPHYHLQYSRTCTASSTRTPTTRCRWRCSSAPRTPAVTGSRGKVRGRYYNIASDDSVHTVQAGPCPSTSCSPSSSSPPWSPSSATRPSSGCSGGASSESESRLLELSTMIRASEHELYLKEVL